MFFTEPTYLKSTSISRWVLRDELYMFDFQFVSRKVTCLFHCQLVSVIFVTWKLISCDKKLCKRVSYLYPVVINLINTIHLSAHNMQKRTICVEIWRQLIGLRKEMNFWYNYLYIVFIFELQRESLSHLKL